jgi:threonine dehydratase
VIRDLAEDILLVSEQEIRGAVKYLLERLKILVEPSGAVAAAAVLYRRLPPGLGSVGVILSGGNVDLDVLGTL